MQLKWEKKLHRLSSIVSACFIIFAIIGAILNLSLFLFNTDAMHVTGMHSAAAGSSNPIIYLYKSNTLTGIFVGLCLITFLLAVILAVVMIVRKKRCSQLTLPERRGALQIIRIFAGFALLAIPVIYAVFSLYGFELGKFRGTINLGAMLIALPASLYFLFPGIADRFSEFLQTIFGMCLIVFAILSAMTTHVYMYEGLTSPVRIMNLLSMTALMLFTLYELRFFASRPLPNMYLATAGLATFFCATNGLPRLILTFIGEMSVSVQTIYACFEVTIALYAACRMMLFLSEWSYTMQNAANEDELLPDTVSLGDPASDADTVEPDYTEDSEIESPILEAKIDIAMFDLAFEGLEVDEVDTLDSLMNETTNDTEDPLATMMPETLEEEPQSNDFDPLDLLSDLLPDAEQIIDEINQKEPTPNATETVTEEKDDLDSLADSLFNNTEE